MWGGRETNVEKALRIVKFGRLTVLAKSEKQRKLITVCACGTFKEIDAGELVRGSTQSCGCLRRETSAERASKIFKGAYEDLTGNIYGRLTALSYSGTKENSRTSMWSCLCECGNIKDYSRTALVSGQTQSCGCLQKELVAKRRTKVAKKEEYQKKYPVKVWLEMPEVWRTEAEYWKYLRGQFRRIWKDFPTKNKFKAMQMVPNFEGSGITNPRVKKVAQCNYCKEWFTGNSLQVDHVSPVGSFKNYDDAAVFLYRLLVPMANMQLLCADKCHTIKSYAERMGMSMEDAIIEKQCVAFGKLPAAEQSAKFIEIGLNPNDYSTKEKRRDAYREYLKAERDKNAPAETTNRK